MVLHNPNNWHWVNKDASPWARQWFDDNLAKIEAKEGDVTAKISKVISMDGDVDVAQRKGKVITIFDVKLTLEFTGTYCHRIQSLALLVHAVPVPKSTCNPPTAMCAPRLKLFPLQAPLPRTARFRAPSPSPRSPTSLRRTSLW
jgi:hypothetical protein